MDSFASNIDELQWNGERERERRRHFKEKMSLEEAHHHRRSWIRAWRNNEMTEDVEDEAIPRRERVHVAKPRAAGSLRQATRRGQR